LQRSRWFSKTEDAKNSLYPKPVEEVLAMPKPSSTFTDRFGNSIDINSYLFD
jgi:hypothetical protein